MKQPNLAKKISFEISLAEAYTDFFILWYRKLGLNSSLIISTRGTSLTINMYQAHSFCNTALSIWPEITQGLLLFQAEASVTPRSPTATAGEGVYHLDTLFEACKQCKSFPNPKICITVNEIPIWARHSTADISSKETDYTSKPLLNTQVNKKDENTGREYTHFGNEDVQLTESCNGTPAIKTQHVSKTPLIQRQYQDGF